MAASNSPRSPESVHAIDTTTRHLRVLVVDATQSMAQAITVILTENGHDASPAFSAAEPWRRVVTDGQTW